MNLLLLGIALSPLFQSARNLAREGRCDAALPLYLQIAYSPDSPEGAQALLGGSRCALALGDTALSRVLLTRFLHRPDPYLPLMQEAWTLARALEDTAHPAFRLFEPYLFTLPPETLQVLLPRLPDSLMFGIAQELRASGKRVNFPENRRPCSWILHEGRDTGRMLLCRGDTLQAVLAGNVSPEAVASWIFKDSLRCLPGDAGPFACTLSVDSVLRVTPDSLRDSVLRVFEGWGWGWPEERSRWRKELRWEQSGQKDADFYPLRPAPGYEGVLLSGITTLSPETILARARRVWLLEGWPPPHTGIPPVDRKLFELHYLRFARDRFWERSTGALLDSLVGWMGVLDSLPFLPVLDLSLAADLPRPPVTRIPIPELSSREVLLLARFLGRKGLERPFRDMMRYLKGDLARKAAFAFFVEAHEPDSAFRYLDVRDGEALRDYLLIVPPETFREALGLYTPHALKAELPLLARVIREIPEPPEIWRGFLARPLPDTLRLPLARHFLRKALQAGNLEEAGVLSLHAPGSPEARVVRFLLGLSPKRPEVDSSLLAVLPENLRIHWMVDTLTPFPTLDSLPSLQSLSDRLRMLLTMKTRDTLLLEHLQGALPRELASVGRWLHRRARDLYREGDRVQAGRIWSFLLRAEDRKLQALALYHLGILEKDERRLDRAVAYLERLVQDYADIQDTWKEGAFLLAGIYAEQREPGKALRVLESLKGLVGPEEEGERRYFAMQARKALGDYARAVLEGQILWERFRKDAPGWAITAALDVAQFWVIRGHTDRARDLLQDVVNRFPNHPLSGTAQAQLQALSQLETFQGR